MTRLKVPTTQAIRFLRSKRVSFKPFTYTYADYGGAVQAAEALQVTPHRVVKTLVMETGGGSPLLALMHGGRTISTRKLARVVGTKRIHPVHPDKTMICTGYQVGGISPFGTRNSMPVYVQTTILKVETIFINGGRRGFLVEIEPAVLVQSLGAIPVDMVTAES